MYINENHTEYELLCLLKKGDCQAFEQLYERYKARIYGISLKLVKSEALAEEILQDVFVKIWINRQQINEEKPFPSYLFRIAENLVMDMYRNAARDRKLLEGLVAITPDTCSIEEALYGKERIAMLNQAIEQLPPQRRKVFTLCKLEGKSYEEAGRELGITVSTVNDHVVKATRAVRACLFSNQEIAVLLIIAASL